MASNGAYTVTIGSDDFGALGHDLRTAAARFRGVLQATLVQEGDDLTKKIKAKAGEHSTTIPNTVVGRARLGEYEIDAGGADVPLAGLYELGNRSKGSQNLPEFEHPVWGHMDNWQWQWRYPFMRPIWETHRHEIYAKFDAVWDLTFWPSHFPTEPVI